MILFFFRSFGFWCRFFRCLSKDFDMIISFLLFCCCDPCLDFFFFCSHKLLVLLVSYFLRMRSLLDTSQEMTSVQHPLKSQNRSDRIRWLCSFVKPVKRFFTVQLNGGRTGHRIVGSDFLNKLTISWCTLIGSYNVVKRFPSTIVDADVLAALPEHAWLVNVGRGATVAEEA